MTSERWALVMNAPGEPGVEYRNLSLGVADDVFQGIGIRKLAIPFLAWGNQEAKSLREHPRFSCRFLAGGEKWETRIFAWRRRAKM